MTELSLEKYKNVYGIKVKKLCIGKYLALIPKIKEFQEDLFEQIFGEKDINILDTIVNLDVTQISKMLESAITYAPEMFIDFLVKILEVDKEEFLNNENIGIYELLEIIQAFIEINQLGKILTHPLIKNMTEKMGTAGFKKSLPLA